ncbi:MAG: hypothetical protein ACFFDS_04260 [Candidatus Thorarchaeota archaeon]
MTFLIIISLIFSSLLFSTVTQGYSENSNENLFLLTKRTNEEIDVDIKTIVDESGNFHLFVRTVYENDSFSIFHAVNDEVNFIILEDLHEEVFDVFSTPAGVFLFYGHSTWLGLTKFYMYRWTPEAITNEEIISHNQVTSRMFDPIPYFYYNETDFSFDLIMVYFVSEDPVSEIAQTKFRHYKIYPSGLVSVETNWIIDFEYDFLVDIDYLNGTVYAHYLYMQQSNPDHVYRTVVTNETVEYESNNMTLSEGGFIPEFCVSKDGTLNSLLFQGSKLYYLSYSINETISFDMYNVTDIGIDVYSDFTVYKYEDYQSYIIGSKPYIEYPGFFTNKNFIAKILKLDHKDGNITIESFELENIPEKSEYHSFHVLNPNNESSRILTHSSTFNQEEYRVKLSPYTDFIGFIISSNNSIIHREEPILYNLDIFTSFQYFWKNTGIILVCIIGVVGLTYLIFRKSINESLRKMKEYLMQPTKLDISRFSSFFVNIWFFIVNGLTTIYILFKTNKKRHLMNLLGMTVLTVIVISSVNLYASKQQVLFSEYTEKMDLLNDSFLSMDFAITYDTIGFGSNISMNTDYDSIFGELLTFFQQEYSTLASLIKGVYHTSVMTGFLKNPLNESGLAVPYASFPDSYANFVDEFIIEGRLPDKKGEVIVHQDYLEDAQVNVNDSIRFFGDPFGGPTPFVNLTIVGTYNIETQENFLAMIAKHQVPKDPLKAYNELFGLGFDPKAIVAFNSFYFDNLEDLYPFLTVVQTFIQFQYDFTDFTPLQMENLANEHNILAGSGRHDFNFTHHGTWEYYEQELTSIVEVLVPNLRSSIFMFFTLAIPILYLAIFLIFETNEIYSKSLEQEIEIFQLKGLSTLRIGMNYTILKFIEALFASILGFLIAVGLTFVLLRIDYFVSFKNIFFVLDFSLAPLSAVFTTIGLVLLGIPKIIQFSRTKQGQQKTPQRLVKLFKQIRLPSILLTAGGVGFVYLSIFLYKLISANVGQEANTTILMIFIYFAGMEALVALLGFGLLLKELHSIIVISISKISWQLKKTVSSLSLVEVRSDIKLFNNVFLTFLILTGIILPSIICPISIQYNITKDQWMYNGSDLYVKNWLDENVSLLPEIRSFPEVESVANISYMEGSYRVEGEFVKVFIINNVTEYLQTVKEPPKRLFKKWEEKITALGENATMMTNTYFHQKLVGKSDVFEFRDIPKTILVNFTVIGEFDYLPSLYSVGPYKPGKTDSAFCLVVSEQNYYKIIDLFSGSSPENWQSDRLLINLKEDIDPKVFKAKLEDLYGYEIISTIEGIETTQYNSYPFYTIIAAEFVISILVCLIVVVFISISNPIKMLQQRVHKNDRLKKIGISTKRIVNMSTWEIFATGVLPGILLGTGFGFGIITLFIRASRMYFYSGMNFLIVYSPFAMIISYVLTPLLFFSIFYVSMKGNYAKYQPRNLE